MQGINDIMFVFYYKSGSDKEYYVTQPITLGEIMNGDVEFELSNGDSLPLDDIDWSKDDLKMAIVPNRTKEAEDAN